MEAEHETYQRKLNETEWVSLQLQVNSDSTSVAKVSSYVKHALDQMKLNEPRRHKIEMAEFFTVGKWASKACKVVL